MSPTFMSLWNIVLFYRPYLLSLSLVSFLGPFLLFFPLLITGRIFLFLYVLSNVLLDARHCEFHLVILNMFVCLYS